MEVDEREEKCNTTNNIDGQDKVDPDHQQTGDPENSTEIKHVENEEGDGKSKKEDKKEKKTYQQAIEE